jgi:hypothetical protein
VSKPWERVQQEQAAAPSADPATPQQPHTVPGIPSSPFGQIGGGVAAATSNTLLGSTLGPELPGITLGLNAFIEWLKNEPWFNERYTFHYLALACALVAIIGWWVIKQDPFHAITNGLALLGNAHITYNGIKATGTGILKPTEEASRWAAKGQK